MPSPHVVFIADDDPDDRMFFRMARERSETACAIEIFSDGLELLERLQELSRKLQDGETALLPGLILLDMHMPRKGGLVVAEELRQDAWLCHIPIVMLTNSPLDRYDQRGFDVDIKWFLEKPVDMDGYVRLLASLETYFQP